MSFKEKNFWSDFVETLSLKEVYLPIIFFIAFNALIMLFNVTMFGLNPYSKNNFSNPEYKNSLGIKSKQEAQDLMFRLSFMTVL